MIKPRSWYWLDVRGRHALECLLGHLVLVEILRFKRCVYIIHLGRYMACVCLVIDVMT